MNASFKIIVNDGGCLPACQIENNFTIDGNGIFSLSGIELIPKKEFDNETGIVRQSNIIRNNGDSSVKINRVSNAFIEGVAPDFHNKDVVIHICKFCWQGEAQWLCKGPYEMGLFPVSEHKVCRQAVSISGKGSWSTDTYYPILIIENKTDNKTWFFEHEGAVPWEIEIGTYGMPHNLELNVDINTINEYSGKMALTLEAGGCFESPAVVYGVTDGSFSDAVNKLISFKRRSSVKLETLPVCFNNYMNCMWINPEDKQMIPIINAAAEVGCEYFCIDDGWYKKNGIKTSIGIWEEDDEIYSEGFKALVDYIISKGMKPGIWFEMETCSSDSTVYNLCENAVLKRDGNVVESTRAFANFACKEVVEYFKERIDYFYSMGIRYIKNDYNHTLGCGCDDGDKNYGLGILRSIRAYYSFIDEINARYPDLIIENCASGAMRCDSGTMKHFYLESISDQEHFFNIPSIIQGMYKCMPPEKCLIWSYPYPLYCADRFNFDKVMTKEHLDTFADGSETAYNMASTLFGVPLLSGHIECADNYNKKLIKKALELYKADRDFIKESFPLELYEQQKIYKNGYSVLALESDKKIRIGIFKYKADGVLAFSTEKLSDICNIREIYPADGETAITLKDGYLEFSSEKEIDARVYEIEKMK